MKQLLIIILLVCTPCYAGWQTIPASSDSSPKWDRSGNLKERVRRLENAEELHQQEQYYKAKVAIAKLEERLGIL